MGTPQTIRPFSNRKRSKPLKYATIKLLLLGCAGLIVLAQFQGCAAIVPNTVTPELEHMSHASQHRPFTESPTRYGANIASVVLGWNLPRGVSLQLAEGISLDKRYATPSCGEIEGPREEFSARIGYSFKVRP